jgi:hypothetical protein
MTLSEYMARKRLSDIQMGKLVTADRKTVWRWRKGQARPSHAMMRKIAVVTEDAVRPRDWLADLIGDAVHGGGA